MPSPSPSPPTNTPTANYTVPLQEDEEILEVPDMEFSMIAVENLLKYRFVNRKLLEEALTHTSYTGSPSYQRLEFIGDKALGLAFSNYVFLRYPGLDPGKLHLLHSANTSNERFARVAVRHQLHKYLRHNIVALDEKIREFVVAVGEEDETEIYGGLVKAPKVLADIVESLAAAVYIDCNFDLPAMWVIFRDFLEPMVMLDVLERQPQPITLLFGMCGKDGKQVAIGYWRKEDKIVAGVYVNGEFVTSASSDHKDTAKLHAAKAALRELSYDPGDSMDIDIFGIGDTDIEGAKQKLNRLCGKKKWPKPIYKIQEELGHGNEKRYICSVEIENSERVLFVKGKEKPRVKEAENSAACFMLRGLLDSGCI